jgi:hypothetical protein
VIATGLVLASIAIHLLDDTVRPDQHRPPSLPAGAEGEPMSSYAPGE